MKKLLIALLVSVSTLAMADCPNLYPNNKTMSVPKTVELCNIFYVSRFNTFSKAVVVTSERLSKNTPVSSLSRITSFHADSRLTNTPRPGDYTGSGYDKGHMVASDDASTSDEMYETFLMTNMTPQEPTLNQQSWRLLEDSIRRQFLAENVDYWVVTVALYKAPTKYIGKNIPVPKGYWKIVYRPTGTDYYFAENKPYAKVQKMSAVDVNALIQNAQNY